MSRCTLDLGGTVIVAADDGTLGAEYGLFDPGDIELSASGPGTIRETGYRTTVGEALARLAHFGITRALAEETAAAAKPWIARTYSRGAAVRRIVDQLDAAELFDGHTYDPVSERYAGAWLDLPSLVGALSDLDPARSATLIQAFYLAALLAERSEEEPLTLGTIELTAQRRPGERTFKRVALKEPQALLRALSNLKRPREPVGTEAGPGRQEIVSWLRDRVQLAPAASDRFAAIESALGTREAPVRGPLVDADLWALETKLSLGETDGVVERVAAIERRHGRLPATAYLRARAAFMAGTEEPRAIAERASALSTSMGAFHELQLLAAQAWAAAGEVRQAHAFARDLLEDSTACDALRMRAREVLDATGRATTAPEGGILLIPKPPLTPSGTELDPASHPPIGGFASRQARDRPRPGDERAPSLAIDLSLPVLVIQPRATDWTASLPPEGEVDVEMLEMLGLPPGMGDEPPPHDEAPRSPAAARLVCTYLARELGRELRMRHGIELRSDVEGLEMAQRYLCETITVDRARAPQEEREVMRHGAFLSELLARRLHARWADLESSDPGRWAMLVLSRSHPEEMCRVWPFRRVLRFVAQRHRERDLVSYYLQLEARSS
jgi:hypothetical protein